ncbi:serine/threonine-protein kinase pak-1-like [Tachypleus tridentatus]|uniref:serine/threonine-protein kinase pak-1-like n=1 Tax=Tachypleus tridentatus TaxID=6853 RepID=UPI003FD56385
MEFNRKLDNDSAGVYKAIDRGTGLEVAVKKISLTEQPDKEGLITELLILCDVKHLNLVNYVNSYLVRDELWSSVLSVT